MNSVEARRQKAEAVFKKKEKQSLEGQKALQEYKANIEATRQKTARLRALRLARDEASKASIRRAAGRSGCLVIALARQMDANLCSLCTSARSSSGGCASRGCFVFPGTERRYARLFRGSLAPLPAANWAVPEVME